MKVIQMNKKNMMKTSTATSTITNDGSTKDDRFIIDRLKRKTKKMTSFVVHPTSSLLYYWTALVCTGCFYNLLMVGIFIYREIHKYYFYHWLTCNFIFDIIFLIDIFIQSRTGYIHDSVTGGNLKVQVKSYFHSSNFWLDVGSIFPFDFLLIYRSDISFVRLNRLLKSYRFNYFIDRTEIRTNWPNAFKIFVLIMTCIVLFHWNAAVYFLISITSGIDSEDRDAWQFTYTKIADPVIPECNTFQLTSDSTSCIFNETGRNINNRSEYIDQMMQYWQNRSKILKFPNFSKEYALSIYWSSLTLTTKGQQPYPMNSLEDGLEIIDTLIGLLIFAVIIGSVGSIISSMNKEKSEFQETLDGIKFHMNYRKVDSDIQKRVLNCCDYIHDQGISKDETALLEGLPRKLHGQLAIHLHMDTLQNVELLQDCEQGLLFELILRLKFQLFSPNDYVCRRGERAREMYIVKRGQLNCVSDDGEVVLGILKEGAVFGQLAILNLSGKVGGNTHNITIRSIGYTDVYILRQEDVDDVLQEYPLARRNLTQKAIKMLREDGFWNDTIVNEEVCGINSTLEEQLDGIAKTFNTFRGEINQLYEAFDNMSLDFKQRLSRLEGVHKRRCERQKNTNTICH